MFVKSKILVVEDEEGILNFLDLFLNDEGFTVEVLSDARQTMERVIEFQPDLILHDIVMPGVNTFELYRELKTTTSTNHIPIILMSASRIKDNQLLNVDRYIGKPFDLEELLTQINKVLKS